MKGISNMRLQRKKDIMCCQAYLSPKLQINAFVVEKYFATSKFSCIKEFRNSALVSDLLEKSNCKNPVGAIIQEMTPFTLGTYICFEARSTRTMALTGLNCNIPIWINLKLKNIANSKVFGTTEIKSLNKYIKY